MQRTKQVSANGFEPKMCQGGDGYLHLYEVDRRLVAVPIRQLGVLPLAPAGAGLGPCGRSWLWLPALTVFSVWQGNLQFNNCS